MNGLKPKHVPLHTAKPSQMSSVVLQKRRKGSIENAFNVEDMNHFRDSITRMFYSGGLSFHLARNPYYVSSYSFAASYNLSDFLPPNALRTTLLKQERADIDRLLQPIIIINISYVYILCIYILNFKFNFVVTYHGRIVSGILKIFPYRRISIVSVSYQVSGLHK